MQFVNNLFKFDAVKPNNFSHFQNKHMNFLCYNTHVIKLIVYNFKEISNMPIKKLYLELTDSCNLNCKMCYRKSWGQAFGDMKDDVFSKLINELKTHRELKEIVIGGIGEPTFSKHFKRTLKALKDYKLVLTTNGTLLNDELDQYLIKHVDKVTVSIDGASEKYRDIRGTDLDTLIKKIKMLSELKQKLNSSTPLIDVQFVLSNENVNEIFQVIDIASDLKADRFIVSNIIPQIEDNKDNILYRRYENIDLKNLFDKVMIYGLHKGVKIKLPNYELKTIRECSFVEDSCAFICSSGDVSPCYRFSHNYTEYVFGREKQINKFIFGNIETDSLINIWNSEKYIKFRNYILNNQYPSCIDCDYVIGCDYVKDTEMDCYTISPSCGDCLWSRKFVQCP